MLYFKTRTEARNFANKSNHNHKVVDNGSSSEVNRRWAVKVL